MSTIVDWLFDVISPFVYLQLEQSDALQQANDIAIRPRPLVLGAILHRWGQKGPAEVGAERVFMYRHALFRVQQLGIPFRMPPVHPFNPTKVLWLTTAMGGPLDAVRAVFRYIQYDCNDVASPEGFAALCEAMGLAEDVATVEQPAVKNTLRAHIDVAIALGVFGVPTLAHEGELFWGEDATAILLQSLHADWLPAPEVQRVSTLPVGIQHG